MQDRYAGDVGDFAKFGLLRTLLVGPGRRPGVAWYYVPPGEDKPPGNDGRHVEYLDRPDFQRCDPNLHETLQRVVTSGARQVAALDLSTLLGSNAVGFVDPLPGRAHHFQARADARKDWLGRALEALSGCDGVFLDPDNGIASPKVGAGSVSACKFAFLDEIDWLTRNRLGVVYHHFGRHGSHFEQVCSWAAELARHTRREPALVSALRWRPYSPRVFFILAQADSGARVSRDIATLLRGEWGEFFSEVAWQAGS